MNLPAEGGSHVDMEFEVLTSVAADLASAAKTMHTQAGSGSANGEYGDATGYLRSVWTDVRDAGNFLAQWTTNVSVATETAATNMQKTDEVTAGEFSGGGDPQ